MVEARAPWMADEARYPVAVALEEDGSPRIEEMRRRDFPDWLVASKFNKWFLNREYLSSGWRCTITGVRCHAAPKRFYDGNHRGMPWALTIDHLVPTKMRQSQLADRLINQAVAGWYVNYKIGHIPLALKLHHRNVLKGMRFWEREPNRLTCLAFRDVVIRTENDMKLCGFYPWQPWSYTNIDDRRKSEAFMNEIQSIDGEFLHLEAKDRKQFMDDFKWRW